MTSIKLVRYIVFVVLIMVAFFNVFDAISKGAKFSSYLLYAIPLFIMAILLVIFENNLIIGIIFLSAGVLIVLDQENPMELSGSIGFYMLAAMVLEKTKPVFIISCYLIAFVSLVSNFAFNKITPIDAVNVIIVYSTMLLLSYLLRNEIEGRINNG